MSANGESPDQSTLNVGNYCVSFIDLLGQRAALLGQTLLPPMETEEQRKRFHNTLRKSIGAIAVLQQRAEDMMRARPASLGSGLRAKLPPGQQVLWDEAQKTRVITQRWSDGLVSFACLGDERVKCHLNNVFQLFSFAGSLCFLGLASKMPIRGAIEIAWGIELHPNELYGAAVARAYELESEVAKYPRVVIGQEMLAFLDMHCHRPGDDPFTQIDHSLAKLCRDMIEQDTDGNYLLHYLGETFRQAITTSNHLELYSQAYDFVLEQLHEHQEAKPDQKLALRYGLLQQYFEKHRPPELRSTEAL